jgi:hypothetical protein
MLVHPLGRAAALLVIAAATSGCGFTALKLFRTTEDVHVVSPLLESDASAVCDGSPCDGIRTVVNTVHWRLPLLAGTLADGTAAGLLLSSTKTPARIAGYGFVGIAAMELSLQLAESFYSPKLDIPTAVLWRGRWIELADEDMPVTMYPGAPVSVAKIVERRARRSRQQTAESRKE